MKNSAESCPTNDELRLFVDGALANDAEGAIASHLDACAACRRRMDDARLDCVDSALLREAFNNPPARSTHLASAIAKLQAAGAEDDASQVAHDDGRAPLPPSPNLGYIGRLGAIDLVRVVGRGGMGVVYEGFDTALRRRVAVKTLPPRLSDDPQARARFLREARAAAAVTHENVVHIYTVDETADVPFLVMQYVEGQSLANRVAERGPLSMAELQRLGVEVASGLAAAHALGLIHRDIKPGNVLLDAETGAARITDFGLAKAMNGTALTSLDTIAGTPAFMSPEQAAGEELDGRTDLFSLGSLLYFAATGKPSFVGDSPFVILQKIRFDPPPKLANAVPDLPKWFCDVVDRLLEKTPDQRLGSAADVALYLDGKATIPAEGPMTPAIRQWLISTALGIAAVVGGYFAWARKPADDLTPGRGGSAAAKDPANARIVGRSNLYASLADAVASAVDGAVIELTSHGPYRSKSINVVGKRLTIRAASGFHPVVEPESPNGSDQRWWIQTDSDLTLLGLDIRWQNGAEEPPDQSNFEGVVQAFAGRLTMEDCSIGSNAKRNCVTIRPGAAGLIRRCRLWSQPGQGANIVCGSAPGSSLVAADSTLEGGNNIHVVLSPGDVPAEPPFAIELRNCLLSAAGDWGFAFGFWFVRTTSDKVKFDVSECAIRANHWFGIPARGTGSGRALPTLMSIVDWKGDSNVLDRRINVVTGVFLNPYRTQPSAAGTVERWLGRPENNKRSVVADIRFQEHRLGEPLRLESLQNASGPIPSSIGPAK